MKKLYLVDVSSIFFRAFYAIRQLNNSKGLPTNALYGFLATMTKLIKEHRPDGLALCFDTPDAGFREEIYPEYKANRDDAPEDLVLQFPYLKKLSMAMSLPSFEISGFEADDIIGTLAKKCKRNGLEVVIVSGDKDFTQLVEAGVSIYDPAKDLFINRDGVLAKMGVEPSQVIDYLALIGDASDNVPGVDGIGPKGAVKLLSEFKSLDGIYENLGMVKSPRINEMLKTQKKQAYLSQKLVTIFCDCKININIDELKLRPVNRELLLPLLDEFEFKGIAQKLLGPGNLDESLVPLDSKPLVTPVSASASEDQTPETKAFIITKIGDLEKALNPNLDEIWLDVTSRGIAIGFGGKTFRFEGDASSFNQWLSQTLSSRPLKISGYDVKAMAHEVKLSPQAFQAVGTDVLLMAYCTGDNQEYDLGYLSKKLLNIDLPEFALPEERLGLIKKIQVCLSGQLEPQNTNKILTTIEQPLAPVLYSMEKVGILLDSKNLNDFSVELLKESQSLEKEICEVAGYEFNISSPKQLGRVLFDKLGLPPVRKTKTGYSTDSDVLEKLIKLHPIAAKILDWREVTKLRSTYVDALPQLVSPETGRVHTTYLQAVAATGRLSSVHPNLQNIPIRTPRGQRIRHSFIAADGKQLISADYSQVELRILAHITGDSGLVRAFESDVDIHSATASEVFDVQLSKVTADQRRAAKAINFGLAYGMSEFGLAESLKIERREAAEFIQRYFLRFSKVQQYMHDVVETTKQTGYAETLFGRRRFYPDMKSSNGRLRQNAERAVINMPIQGAAADVIKLAMVEISKKLPMKFGNEARMLLQVHDELVFEVQNEAVQEFSKVVAEIMETQTPLRVPLKVSVGSGPTWGVAH